VKAFKFLDYDTAEMKAMLNDIISAAERSVKSGLLNETDGRAIVEYTEKLYRELYQGYDELKEADVMLKDKILTYSEEAELKSIEKGIEEQWIMPVSIKSLF